MATFDSNLQAGDFFVLRETTSWFHEDLVKSKNEDSEYVCQAYVKFVDEKNQCASIDLYFVEQNSGGFEMVKKIYHAREVCTNRDSRECTIEGNVTWKVLLPDDDAYFGVQFDEEDPEYTLSAKEYLKVLEELVFFKRSPLDTIKNVLKKTKGSNNK